MFERIVVGTDGSETASLAVDHAIALAALAGARLEIVSAHDPVPQDRVREHEVPDDITAASPAGGAGPVIEAAATAAAAKDVEVGRHPREGDPADALLDVAAETAADLIVVGNRGMTGAARFLLGSVPNKVSHHAPCDVMIVRTSD